MYISGPCHEPLHSEDLPASVREGAAVCLLEKGCCGWADAATIREADAVGYVLNAADCVKGAATRLRPELHGAAFGTNEETSWEAVAAIAAILSLLSQTELYCGSKGPRCLKETLEGSSREGAYLEGS